MRVINWPGKFDDMVFPELPGIDEEDLKDIPQITSQQAFYLRSHKATPEIADEIERIRKAILAKKLAKVGRRVDIQYNEYMELIIIRRLESMEDIRNG